MLFQAACASEVHPFAGQERVKAGNDSRGDSTLKGTKPGNAESLSQQSVLIQGMEFTKEAGCNQQCIIYPYMYHNTCYTCSNPQENRVVAVIHAVQHFNFELGHVYHLL